MVKLGLDCKLFRGAAGETATELVENIKDVSLNMETSEADVTTRKANGWKLSLATLKDASVECTVLFDTEDEDYNFFCDAFMNKTPIALFITDGDGTGLDADFSVTNFSMEQPLEEAVSVSVTFKPTMVTRGPEWKVKSA
jgi:predicted secreted protein